MTRLLAAALAAFTLAAPAQASSVSVFNQDAEGLTFERQRTGGGAHGVEFKFNNIMIGTNTQSSSKNTELPKGSDFKWTDEASFFSFIYQKGISTVSVSQNEDFSDATSLTYEGLFVHDSDALIFEANGRPNLTLTKFNGQDLDIDIGVVGGDKWTGWEKVVFVSDGITDGFTLEGEINMVRGGPSTINIDLGTASKYDAGNAAYSVAPIPVPAALPLLLAGLGGLVLLRRHRRR